MGGGGKGPCYIVCGYVVVKYFNMCDVPFLVTFINQRSLSTTIPRSAWRVGDRVVQGIAGLNRVA